VYHIEVALIYIGATPEYGKAQFLERLEREIQRTKARYPQATLNASRF